ncbi:MULTISPECIES: DsrE family protein [unclassified Haladaptatus]|uniref:DsrE family protein n=1 Tax=unclassified Haladaptatus TaxID=2622732 RepID=UPI0023E8BB04|nr:MULTISPECIES: DsrE family protein [unclassified Haladaptatus]
MNTVFHLSDGSDDAHGHALSNVENLLADDSIAVESVVLLTNGDGVSLSRTDGPRAERIDRLIRQGALIRVCLNSLRTRDMDASMLHPGVTVVPSGVGELTRLQSAGYAYIKTP